MKRLQIPQKLVNGKFYLHQKILRTQNCRLKFIKNLLPVERKKNTLTKQSRFKLRLKNIDSWENWSTQKIKFKQAHLQVNLVIIKN